MFERKKGNGIYRQRSDRDKDGNVKSTHCGTVVSGRVSNASAYDLAVGGRMWEIDHIITELYEKKGDGTVNIANRLLKEFNIGKPVAQDTTGLGKEMWAEEPLNKNVIEKRLKELGIWKGDRRKKKSNEDKDGQIIVLKKRIDELEYELSREREERGIAKKQLVACTEKNAVLNVRLARYRESGL